MEAKNISFRARRAVILHAVIHILDLSAQLLWRSDAAAVWL